MPPKKGRKKTNKKGKMPSKKRVKAPAKSAKRVKPDPPAKVSIGKNLSVRQVHETHMASDLARAHAKNQMTEVGVSSLVRDVQKVYPEAANKDFRVVVARANGERHLVDIHQHASEMIAGLSGTVEGTHLLGGGVQ